MATSLTLRGSKGSPLTNAEIDGNFTALRTTADAATAELARNTQTANYTLVLADAGTEVEINSASASTVTVPPNSSVAFPVGSVIALRRYGSGTVTLTPGAGVTLRNAASALTLRAQYSGGTITKRTADEWLVDGDFG